MDTKIMTVIIVLAILYFWNREKKSNGTIASTTGLTPGGTGSNQSVATPSDSSGISNLSIGAGSQDAGMNQVGGGNLLNDIVIPPVNVNTPLGPQDVLNKPGQFIVVTGDTQVSAAGSGLNSPRLPYAREVTLSVGDIEQLKFTGIPVPGSTPGQNFTFILPANNDVINYFHSLMTGQIDTLGNRTWYTSLDYVSMPPEIRARFTNLPNSALADMTRGPDAEKKWYAPSFGPWV